ncbi:MAG: hypothetical protein RIT19_2491, partial [Verrucomicrobiota bacterium]
MTPHGSAAPSAKRGPFCRSTRREFLWQAGAGFTGTALAGLMAMEGARVQAASASKTTPDANPMAPRRPHHPAKAKSVIFLFMYGGPSHIDTFDYKPKLNALDGKTIAVKTFGRGGKRNEGRVVGTKWDFKRYGQSGKWVS